MLINNKDIIIQSYIIDVYNVNEVGEYFKFFIK